MRIYLSLLLVALCIYLFVTAPAPLPSQRIAAPEIPVSEALTVLAEENKVVRTLWTAEIVGKGKSSGLAFNEDWKEKDVEAGPLPALFLREISRQLEADPMRIGLFLGSDNPINVSNRFRGRQKEYFNLMKRTGSAQFFTAPEVQLETAMFPDVAGAQACVDCHNEHADSPRQDWSLGDMMGATTWTYPDKAVTLEELVEMTGSFRRAARAAYQTYLDKTRTFENPPAIGAWPESGYSLPSADDFMAESSRRASESTLAAILATHAATK
jgi:adenylate cyclase